MGPAATRRLRRPRRGDEQFDAPSPEPGSTDGDLAAEALVEAAGDTVDALGGRVEGRRHGGLARLAAIGRGHAGIAEARQLALETTDPTLHLAQLIADGQRRHDQEPVIADLAEICPQ